MAVRKIVKESEPIPTVLVVAITKGDQIGPYENSENHIRTHIQFDVALQINGKTFNSKLELQKHEDSKGQPLEGWSKGWMAYIEVNTDVPSDYDHSCEICSGNWGVSTAETSGLTAQTIANALFPDMERMGYPIDTQYGHARGFHLFTMRGEKVSKAHVSLPTRKTKTPRFYAENITYLRCPVHGDRVKRDLEPAF